MHIINRKAHFNYSIEEEYEAGLVLVGSEVKSIRLGKVNISEAYIAEKGGELFLTNCHISEYSGANIYNHQPTRQRKLLLSKKEIRKIIGKIQIKGKSVVPIKMFFNSKNFIKLIIGVGAGKKMHDKREDIKQRDIGRRIRRDEE